MAWTAPMTFVDGVPISAEELNTHVRGNLLETAPAKAWVQGGYFVSTDTDTIEERTIEYDYVTDSASTSSSSYTNLSGSYGPEVTAETGNSAIIIISCFMQNPTVSTGVVRMSVEISGATTLSALDRYSLMAVGEYGIQATYTTLRKDLDKGINTFTAKYRSSSSDGYFSNRRLIVVPL